MGWSPFIMTPPRTQSALSNRPILLPLSDSGAHNPFAFFFLSSCHSPSFYAFAVTEQGLSVSLKTSELFQERCPSQSLERYTQDELGFKRQIYIPFVSDWTLMRVVIISFIVQLIFFLCVEIQSRCNGIIMHKSIVRYDQRHQPLYAALAHFHLQAR